MSLSRSEQMSRIRSTHTSPERLLRSALWAKGLRYRLHGAGLPGKPDLVVGRARVVVFIDGCFWHGCPVHYVPPLTRQDYWSAKLGTNVTRDIRRTAQLEELGWRVVRIWECEAEQAIDEVLGRTMDAIADPSRLPPQSWRVFTVHTMGELEQRTLRELRGSEPDRQEERFRSFVKQGRRARALSE